VSAVEVSRLSYAYPAASQPALRDVSFTLPRGARCLLLGANGVGKSTLLRLIAGRHMIRDDQIPRADRDHAGPGRRLAAASLVRAQDGGGSVGVIAC